MDEDEEVDSFTQRELDQDNGYVACDISCKAKQDPETLDEYRAAYIHWKSHSNLCGCSHGC